MQTLTHTIRGIVKHKPKTERKRQAASISHLWHTLLEVHYSSESKRRVLADKSVPLMQTMGNLWEGTNFS